MVERIDRLRFGAKFLEQVSLGKETHAYLVEHGGSRDKYAQVLAHIVSSDGRFVNEVLLSEGYAYADRSSRHSYSQKYLRLEATVRSLHKGSLG